MDICHILGIAINAMAILLIVFMLYLKNKKEREEEEIGGGLTRINSFKDIIEDLRTYTRNDALKYREWLYFGLNYGCNTPAEMKRLIDDLVKKINKLEEKA